MKLDPRRRFRDRLLIGMVAVALIPLLVFAVLAAVELDAVSRGTAEQAQGVILQDEQARQQSGASAQAGLLGQRLNAIDNELAALGVATSRALSGASAPLSPGGGATVEDGAAFSGGPGAASSVVVAALGASPSDLRLAGATAALVPLMQALRHDDPEISEVWVANTTDTAMRAVPGFDVAGALLAGRLDPAHPAAQYRADVFTTSRLRYSSSRTQWSDPDDPDRDVTGPYWTDPYPLLCSGLPGVTAWLPLRDGRTVVGADISAAALLGTPPGEADAALPAGAYTVVISSGGTVLYAQPGATTDFRLPTAPLGAALPLPANADFRQGLAAAESSGQPVMLTAHLGGSAKDVFVAPVFAGHWLMLRAVPTSDLAPDLTGLTVGITAGIHRLFPLVVLPALLLLLVLAFLVASVLSRRLVGPVRNLTVAAETLASGRTDVPVPPQGHDEVGVLAATLERMRQEITTQREAILAAAAELEERVAQRTLELRDRNEELVALNDLAASLTRSLDPHLILEDALEAVRAIQPLRAGRGYVLDGEQPLAAASWSVADGVGASLDLAAAEALRRSRAVRRRVAGGTVVGWPLQTRQGRVGALAVLVEHAPRASTRRLLQAVCDQVALALRTSRLSAAGRDHAVLEERTRLAREIHDTLAQQLTGIVIQLEAAGTLGERGSARALDSVRIARDLARSALQEARRSVWNLRPAPLRATGLLAALQREVDAWESRTGTPVRLRVRSVPARPALQPAAEVALLRVLQEALSNVAQHASATRVDISMRSAGEELVLSIRDDGCGFDPAAPRPREDCFGLDGMRERVRSAGGALTVMSGPRGGTEVVARLPLTETAAVADSA